MSSTRSLCSVCGKVPSLSFCTGCEKVFCLSHAEEHRLDLSSLLEKIVVDHRHCKQSLLEYTDESLEHPLMKQISDWECHSIEKIQQLARESRQRVRAVLVQFASKAMETMKTLTEDLTHAQQEENFSERDLRQWMETMTKIKKELDKPPTIQIRKGSDEQPFIARLLVNVCEIFDQCTGKIAIKDEGRLIVNGGVNAYGTVRSQGEYSVGRHRFRLKIEHTGRKKWNIIGIVSKSVPIQSAAFSTLSSFGWLANNFVCRNGKVSSDSQGYQSDLERNDIVELIVDCQQQKIRWTNERTRNTHELTVDLDLCPFPWQVHVGLYYGKDRIRLLWK